MYQPFYVLKYPLCVNALMKSGLARLSIKHYHIYLLHHYLNQNGSSVRMSDSERKIRLYSDLVSDLCFLLEFFPLSQRYSSSQHFLPPGNCGVWLKTDILKRITIGRWNKKGWFDRYQRSATHFSREAYIVGCNADRYCCYRFTPIDFERIDCYFKILWCFQCFKFSCPAGGNQSCFNCFWCLPDYPLNNPNETLWSLY